MEPADDAAPNGGETECAVTNAAEEVTEQDRSARPITFTVDGEPVTTTERHLTPNQILELAGLDPASHYLVEIKDRHQTSYQGRGGEPMRVHNHEVFVSVSTGPTPVS
jgi:hypothetical protein